MEGVMDGTSVPTLENPTVFGPKLCREEEKDEETVETAQTRMDNDRGISREGSTVGIGSSNAAEASSTLVAPASNSGTVPIPIQALTPSRTIFVPTEKPSPREQNPNICILYYTHIRRSLKQWIVYGIYCGSDNWDRIK